jgi:predicted HTH domain antitoxin
MNVTLTIPETVFELNGGQIARELLERAALEAFRAGAISLGRLAEILDLTIDEANAFLKAHHTRSEMTAADIEEGRATLKALFSQ